nr:alkaline phosphatase PhoX [Caldalkalibacillus salinus]
MSELSRRKFLTYMGSSTAALVAASSGLNALTGSASALTADHLMDGQAKGKGKPLTAPFNPIQRTWENELVLPKGYTYNIIASYGDEINAKGELFGDSADLTVYFPIDTLEGGHNAEEGLIWVNHEFPEPENYMTLLGIDPSNYDKNNLANYPELLRMQKEAVGGSVIRVKKAQDGTWSLVKDDEYNRRYDGRTPIELAGPVRGSSAVNGATEVEGTLGNCSGGRTLWNTALSCEENTTYGDSYGWPDFTDEHYGWVVEVDPFNPSKPAKKQTALGRFAHENTAMGMTEDGRVVVYMGDDKRGECFYKFISDKTFNPNNREANFDILENGTLYVANLAQQQWLSLDYDANPDLQEAFTDQADVLTHAREAARIVGGTLLDRPEDVEINPNDGTVFLSLTNNSNHGNFHGQIVRFIPADGDHGSDAFTFEVFVAGGKQSGITCPDNLHFDSNGNLWVVEDFGATEDNVYAAYKNCGVFIVPTDGKDYGEPFQFASGPLGCELTGPWLTPDEKTLFIDVQHPDTWNPYPGQTFGRSCLVAIQGGHLK